MVRKNNKVKTERHFHYFPSAVMQGGLIAGLTPGLMPTPCPHPWYFTRKRLHIKPWSSRAEPMSHRAAPPPRRALPGLAGTNCVGGAETNDQNV